MRLNSQQRQIIKKCQASATWFLSNFGKIKHQSAGILPFRPFSYQRESIKAFRKNRFNIFRKCFAKGSMVWTPFGPKPIETIIAGDIIYVYNSEFGIIETTKVREAWCNGEQDVVIIRTKSGHRSKCTEDHLFHSKRGWIEAKDLTTNDILTEINEPQRYNCGNHSEAILLGYLITDGYYGGKGGATGKQFNFTNTNWKYLLEFQKHFEIKFNKRVRIKIHNRKGQYKSKKNSYRININNKLAYQWLNDLKIWGHKASKKQLPEIVFSWDNKSISVLLNRLFAGDGWYSGGDHCNEVGIGSESILLLNQIKQLLTRFQIDSKIYQKTTTASLAKLRIFGTNNFYRFVDQIGIFDKTVRHIPKTKGFFNNRIKGQIKSIIPGVKTLVYDMEVESSYHNFIVDGVVVHNCRQAGVSKIAGGFALWFAMMFSGKKILIVSRKDDDAMGFLRDQIIFPFTHLPDWMREVWKPIKDNEHEIMFPNGSHIQSLTSHPDVLRSHASSLNIIDEAAFIPNMDTLWSAGWPTMQHGGSCIAISTSNGLGGWYWSTWTDAEAGINGFNPIMINWWDMDWAIEYVDALSKEKRRIAPRDGIRLCTSKEEIIKYGKYWSPWLEDQYNALQEQGEAWKFKQEVLASFVGSGNTVLSESALAQASLTVTDNRDIIVRGMQKYIHPVTSEIEELTFDFPEENEGLWVWKKPVLASATKRRGNEVVDPGSPAHSYTMGVDISTGKGKDYCAIEVFDVDEQEQVAEFMARVLPREFVKYIDRIGRWYNSALAVVERNNGGDIVIDMLRYDMLYPRLWRKKDINDKPQPQGKGRKKARALKVGHYGFFTGGSSKPIINKYLLNNLRDTAEEGYTIYSKRLLKQLYTYVRKRDRVGRDTDKTEAEEGVNNFDDLVIATGLAFVGSGDAFIIDASNLMPINSNTDFKSQTGPTILSNKSKIDLQEHYASAGGPALLMPMSVSPSDVPETAAQRQLDAYTLQLGGIPISQGKPLVSAPKYFFVKK